MYELEEAMANGTTGKMPGVRELINLYHKPEVKLISEVVTPVKVDPVGRPQADSDKARNQKMQKMRRHLK